MRTSTKIIGLTFLSILQANFASATCKILSSGGNPSDAFLIEGCPAPDTAYCLPAIALISDLAQSMGASTIDCIHSFDYEHLSAFILGIPHKTSPLTVDEQKLLATFIILHFNSSTATINQFIKEPYKKMAETGLMSAVPDWVNHLNTFTVDDFIQKSLDNYGDDEHALGAALAAIFNRTVAVSNEVSKDSLLDYLSKNLTIKTVRGLIEKTRLPFLDSTAQINGQVNRSTDTHRQIQLSLDSRKVDIFLYGGTRGKSGNKLLSHEWFSDLLQKWRTRLQDKP